MRHSSQTFRMGHSCTVLFFILLMASLFFFDTALAQTDAVILSSKNYRPDKKSSDCSSCTCICIQGSLDFANTNESYVGYAGSNSYGNYKAKVGFNFGVFATQPVITLGPGQLAARGGIEFIQKGGKYSESGGYSESYTLNYLELPIDAIYQYAIKDKGSVFAGLGPYFAYGVGGKIKYNDGTPSDNAFGGQNGAKRFDFGLQFIGGFNLSCMASISLSYDLGLLNVSGSGYSNSFTDKNGVFSINLSYCLSNLMHR